MRLIRSLLAALAFALIAPGCSTIDAPSESEVTQHATVAGDLVLDPSLVVAPPTTMRRFRAAVSLDEQSGPAEQTWFWADAPQGIYVWSEDQDGNDGYSNYALWVEDYVPDGDHQVQVHTWIDGQQRDAELVVRVQRVGDLDVALDTSLVPDQVELQPLDDGRPRILARALDDKGTSVDFIEDELVVTTDDPAALAALLERTGGQVVREVSDHQIGAPTYVVVRVAPGTADPSQAAADLHAIDPAVRGLLRVSSPRAFELVATAARETRLGMLVSPNFIGYSSGFLDRVINEGPARDGFPPAGGPKDVPYTPNVATWPHFMAGGNQNIDVVDAWRALALADKLVPSSVRAAVLDGGFSPGFDFPSWSFGHNINVPNKEKCAEGKADCPWHGTNVVQVGFGVTNNGVGTAGPGGPVAHLAMAQLDSGDLISSIGAIYKVLAWNPRIINMSGGTDIPAGLGIAAKAAEAVTTFAHDSRGVLLIAAAGNAGKNVDEEDCFLGICWEEAWHFPCENHGVLCVGGVEYNSKWRYGSSNWGGQVDLFGPNVVYHGASPVFAIGNNSKVGIGTSYAAPFVAGVAALIIAAKPSIGVGELEAKLINEATWSYDTTVQRLVNAYRSVKSALGPVAPHVKIVSPAPSTTHNYGGFGVSLVAEVDDLEDGPSCCTVTWSSNVDGPLGSGRSLNVVFPAPGARTLTVTAVDSSGMSRSATVNINVVNTAPTTQILAPAMYATVYRNTDVALLGRATDPNEITLPCSSTKLTWSSGYGTPFVRWGCNPTVKFPSVGWQLIQFRAMDAYNASSPTASVWVYVDEPPAGVPTASITSPAPGGGVWGNAANTLVGSGYDPDGDSTMLVYRWVVIDRGVRYSIGTGKSLSWTPSSTIPSNCGGRDVTLELTVTDTAGLSSTPATRTTFVNWPPC
jgi:subtilisin family serine protease